MFATTSVPATYESFRRQYGVVMFDVHLVPDEEGFQHYKLCAQQKRHYDLRFRKGQGNRISPKFTPCDKSCATGKIMENASDEMLLAIGINKRVPAGSILVQIENRHLIKLHKEYAGGSIVGPEIFESGKLLANGESMEAIRTLNHSERIDLTPLTVNGRKWSRVLDKEKIITEIVDKITNVDGNVVVTNNEAGLRAERERITQQFSAEMQRADDEQKKRGKEYAKEVGKFLREECGFDFKQVGKLFEIAGPGQCHDAVEQARKNLREMANPVLERDALDDWDGMDLDLMARSYRFSERKDWRRINAGADYIVSIGGVPADKK